MTKQWQLGLMVICLSSVPAWSATPTLVPTGGDYNTITDFMKVVAHSATGNSVDVAVLPTTYAETRAEAVSNGDYDLALSHVADFAAACEAVIDHHAFPAGCRVSLIELWESADAKAPAIVAALSAHTLDAVYILGGDQGAAMVVLAGTPAEAALSTAYARGVVMGGTSAGNSVLSRTMTNGYTDYGDGTVALQLGAIDLWFGTPDPLHRGLSFGSTRAFFDQHLYERGRFGRLLNETARTADQFGNAGLVGVGVDTDTAPVIRADRQLTSVFGTSSLTLVDFRTLGTSWAWVGTDGRPVSNPTPETTPTAALSIRNGLVHVLAPRATGVGYDFVTRTVSLDGRSVSVASQGPVGADCDGLTAAHPLMLGGDLSVGPSWPEDSKVLRAFLARTKGNGPVLVIAAGYDTSDDAQVDLDGYAQALGLSGWAGAVTTRVYPATVTNAELSGAAGVILLASNQGQLSTLLADPAWVQLVRAANRRAPITLLDRSLSAVAGDVYDAVDDSADWIDAWKTSQANVKPGLQLVSAARPVAIEPRLQYDYRYGRLFGIPAAVSGAKRPVVFGISEGSALLVTSSGAQVIGENPVIRTDSARATFYAGENGAVGALNVVLDVFEPAQRTGAHHRRLAPPTLPRRDRSDLPPRLRK